MRVHHIATTKNIHLNIKHLLFCLFFIPINGSATVNLDQQRAEFKKTYDLISQPSVENFNDLVKPLENYPLYPYLHFAYLSRHLDQTSPDQIVHFIKQYEETPLSGQLRTRWLFKLAKKQHWKTFAANYKPQSSTVLKCHALTARIKTRAIDDALLEDITKLWNVGKSQVKACDPAFMVLNNSKQMTGALIWSRIRLAINNGQLGLAQYLAKKLNKADQQWVASWSNVHRDPQHYLQTELFQDKTPLGNEIIIHGLKRLANKDAQAGLEKWLLFKQQFAFSEKEKLDVDKTLAYAAVSQKLPQAIGWLKKLSDKNIDKTQQKYQLRSAIQNNDWQQLKKWTAQKPTSDFNQLRWLYWRARAQEKTGEIDQAKRLYKALAKERDYYGFLAAERLGISYQFNDQALTLPPQQKTELMAIPALTRARELLLLDMREEARREWNYATRNMNKTQLLQVARLAHDWQWHDRTIITLGKAKAYDDLSLRFPLPYEKTINHYAKKRSLASSTIYSLMRSESAFMHDVRSHAGAMGLMQLMPATGKQTAKNIGLKYRNSQQLYDPQTNIALGTAYLKEMLEKYNNNLIMAAAAYNAGPHRVKKWRPKTGCFPAEQWIETIPFTETRRYVRRALFYGILYQWRQQQTFNPIRSQLKPVPALSENDVANCSTNALNNR